MKWPRFGVGCQRSYIFFLLVVIFYNIELKLLHLVGQILCGSSNGSFLSMQVGAWVSWGQGGRLLIFKMVFNDFFVQFPLLWLDPHRVDGQLEVEHPQLRIFSFAMPTNLYHTVFCDILLNIILIDGSFQHKIAQTIHTSVPHHVHAFASARSSPF